MKTLKEQINALSKAEYKEFLHLKDEVKAQNLGRTCEMSHILIKNLENGEIYARFNPKSEYSYGNPSVEIEKMIILEDENENGEEFEITLLKEVEINTSLMSEEDDYDDFCALELFKILKVFKKEQGVQ